MRDDYDSLFLPLFRRKLAWFLNLRWLAALAIIGLDWLQSYFGVYGQPFGVIASIGGALLVFNGALVFAARKVASTSISARWKTLVVWSQLIVDLLALTAIVTMTGRLTSPLLGFFVFHMFFASIFLPRLHAFGAAILAVAMMIGASAIMGTLPSTRDELLVASGWVMLLLFTVYLVSRIAMALREHERALSEQERHIAEITKRQVAQELNMLQLEKLVSIGQLAAGVAHEISNPLAGMDGLLQLMERSPEKIRPDAVKQLREQVARIAETLRQMTSLGRPDLGKPEPVDINELVRETLQIMRYDHRLRSIDVICQLDDTIGKVTVAPRAIQQALMNLLINASDAVEGAETPRIEIRTEKSNEGCWILIRDNGHGIAREDQERIFQPFITSKPIGHGTGLGLPISRDLVAEQGGRLTLKSEPGDGATFCIELSNTAGSA